VGTLTLPVLLSTDIVSPEVDGAVMVTVQLTAPSVPNIPGGQTTPLKSTAVTRLTVEYIVTPKLAEIVTFWEDVKLPAVAVKDAELALAFTVTLDGMVSATLLDCSGTRITAGTAPLNVIQGRVPMARNQSMSASVDRL